jgi:hypothetical protein
MWVEFSVKSTAWDETDDVDRGISGVNNMNTLPFENIEYLNINSIGKQWIRRFALVSLQRDAWGNIRSKFATTTNTRKQCYAKRTSFSFRGKAEQTSTKR